MSGHADEYALFNDVLGRVQSERDALLAENQRLEHERDFLQRELGFKNTQRQEIQRLRDAHDALLDDVLVLMDQHSSEEVKMEARRRIIAREALAGDT